MPSCCADGNEHSGYTISYYLSVTTSKNTQSSSPFPYLTYFFSFIYFPPFLSCYFLLFFCLSVNYFQLVCKHFITEKFRFRNNSNKQMSSSLYELSFPYNFVVSVHKGKSVPSIGSKRKSDCEKTELSGCLERTQLYCIRQLSECTVACAVERTAME